MLESKKNLLSPICQIPSELLARIFHFVQTDTYAEVDADEAKGKDAQLPRHHELGWTKVSHVCRLWRDLAISHASLWTRPPIKYDKWTLEMLKRSSAKPASAAAAAIDHVHTWVNGTRDGDWTSAAIVSDGSYDVPEGLVSSFPVTAKDGRWEIVQGLDISDFSRERIDASVAELAEERESVRKLGLV